jgi:hypothetical protein
MPLSISSLADGATVRWKPTDNSDLTPTLGLVGSLQAFTYSAGMCAGVVGGQSGQTVIVETIFHVTCTASANVAQVFDWTEDGLSSAETEMVYRMFHEADPVGFTPKASLSVSVYNPPGLPPMSESKAEDCGFLCDLTSRLTAASRPVIDSLGDEFVNVASQAAVNYGRRFVRHQAARLALRN